MRKVIVGLGRFSVLSIPLLLLVSCGSDKSPLEAAFLAGKKLGHTEAIKNEVVPTQEEVNPNEAVIEEAPVIESSTTTTAYPTTVNTIPSASYPAGVNNLPSGYPNGFQTTLGDVPGAAPHLGLGASQPFAGSFPYYCDPTSYPAYVIKAIAACRPFLTQIFPAGIPWTDLYSYRAPGYRYRHHLGKRFDNDDDDNDNDNDHRRRRRFRR